MENVGLGEFSEEPEGEAVWYVNFYAYCGMAYNVFKGTLTECRECIAGRIMRRRRREGAGPVAVLEKGKRWEFRSAEDVIMVPDSDGILTLREKPPAEL